MILNPLLLPAYSSHSLTHHKMRLLTHNLLACSAKTCLTTSKNFPLAFKDVKLEIVETELNEGFLKGLIGGGKIEWSGLIQTCKSVSERA